MAAQPDNVLLGMIRNGDWSAVNRAGITKDSGTEAAAMALADRDDIHRLIAVHCIIAGGGSKAPAALLRALNDDNEQVRSTAAKALLDHIPNDDEVEAFKVWDHQPDPTVRYYVTLSLGLAKPPATPELQKRLDRLAPGEPESTTDSLVAALSRLRDVNARLLLQKRIEEAHGSRVPSVLEVFRYVDDPDLVTYLRPLLNRREIALDLSNHTTEMKRRSCDLAIDEISKLAPGQLNFNTKARLQYNDAEIAEAIRLLDHASLPRP